MSVKKESLRGESEKRAINIHVHFVTGVVANAPNYAAQKYFGRSAAGYSRADLDHYYGPRNIVERARSLAYRHGTLLLTSKRCLKKLVFVQPKHSDVRLNRM